MDARSSTSMFNGSEGGADAGLDFFQEGVLADDFGVGVAEFRCDLSTTCRLRSSDGGVVADVVEFAIDNP
jgi:hypothetical protein